MLIANTAWLAVAFSNADLLQSLLEFMASYPDVQAKLKAPPKLAEESAKAGSLQIGRPCEPWRWEVVDNLKRGYSIMQRVNWEFPARRACGPFDSFEEATDGCRYWYKGMNRLNSSCKGLTRSSPDIEVGEQLLASLEFDWAGVLLFLRTMIECGARKAWSKRIEFIALSLERLSSDFREEVMKRPVPWHKEKPANVNFDNGPAVSATLEAEAACSPRCSDDEDKDFAIVHGASTTTASAIYGDLINSANAVAKEMVVETITQARSSHLDQPGNFALCNGTSEDLAFYVEESGEEFLLRPGADRNFHAKTDSVNVRIFRPVSFGFIRYRTRLGCVEIRSRQLYHVRVSGESVAVVAL